MNRIMVFAGAALAALALAAQIAAKAPTKLKGDVGPGFTIHLKDSSGKAVKTLKPGMYSITVVDKASIHDFQLEGPGIGKKGKKQITGVKFVGTKTVTVTLKKGTYTFVCTPHRKIPTMKGTFKVS
jgi:plastocyanin